MTTELELQLRWAEGRWPRPWLRLAGAAGEDGGEVRVCFAGHWNRGPGPDFRDAILLDRQGRVRRGDVELHLERSGWRAHGHHRDPAYGGVLLHVLADPRGLDAAPASEPAAAVLPPDDTSAAAPPCVTLIKRVGARAVSAKLRSLAASRLRRKTLAVAALSDDPDHRAALALARALGQPRNPDAMEHALRDAEFDPDAVAAALGRRSWRRGRGPMGGRDGVAKALSTLLRRWGAPANWAAAANRLARAPQAESVAELRIPKLLGRTRALQTLADAVYPTALANGDAAAAPAALQGWFALPAARYQRTDDLRERLTALPEWSHPETQALLDLERSWCRQGACSICPLARTAPLQSR